MSKIDIPLPGSPILDTWGEAVAGRINDHHDGLQWKAWPIGWHALMVDNVVEDMDKVVSSNAGGAIYPFEVAGGMDLKGYGMKVNGGAATSAELALYRDLGGTTLERVAGSQAAFSATPVTGWYQPTLTSGNITLAPGYYWLAIRCTHATNNFQLRCLATGSGLSACGLYATTTLPALGATLDPADLGGFTSYLPMVFLHGQVAGGVGPFI